MELLKLTSAKKIIKEIPNLKLVIMQGYQNTKLFLQKFTFEIGLRNFLLLKKFKILFIIRGLKGEEIIGTFHKKGLQKTNQKIFRIEKIIKRKRNELYI